MKHLFLILIFPFLFACSSTKNSKTSKEYDESLQVAIDYLDRLNASEIAEDAQSYFIDGTVLQQKGKHADAIIDFKQALEIDSSAAILYSMSRSYLQLGRTKLAINSLVNSLKINEDFVPSIELIASIYVSVGDDNNAIPLLERALDLDPTVMRTLDLGELYERVDPEKALSLYEELYQKYNSFEALRRMANLYDPESQTEDYLRVIEEYYLNNKSNSSAGLSLLEAYLENNKTDKILSLLDSVDKSIPSSELNDFYGRIGYEMIYDTTLDFSYEQTLQYLNKIDNRFYFDWRIQYQSGFIAGNIEEFELSSKYFNNTLKLLDTIPDIPLQMGLFFLNKQQNEFSEEIFGQAIELFPEDPRFYFFKGIAKFNLEKFNEAIVSFKSTIEIDKNFNDAFVQLGITYDQLGDFDKAIYYYEKSLELEPDDPLTNNNLAYSLSLQNRDLEEALEMSKKAVEAQPNNSAYLDTYGWILYLKGEYDQAVEYLEKAVISPGASAEVYEHLGDAYQKIGKKNKAKEAWKKALKLEPNREGLIEKITN